VGKALTDDFHDFIWIFKYMWSHGLISDRTYRLLNVLCDFSSIEHPSALCQMTLDLADVEMGKIDEYNIYTPPCLNSTETYRKQPSKRYVSTEYIRYINHFTL